MLILPRFAATLQASDHVPIVGRFLFTAVSLHKAEITRHLPRKSRGSPFLKSSDLSITAFLPSVSPSDDFPSQAGWVVVPKQEDDRASSWVPRHFITRNPHDSPSQKLSWHGKHGSSEITLDDLQFGFTAMTPGPASTLTDPEFDLLCRQGAFVLPPQWLCDILFQAFFDYIAPTLPIIDKEEFMRRVTDKNHPMPYLLIHAVLLAGCRVCRHTCIRDANGSTTRISRKLYRRAKALYDANYESDQLVVVQTLILLGWYWEGPEGKLSSDLSANSVD